ncbi:MAG: glycosyltransferase family 4 protein [Halobacteriales archaeon]|nr:glycosyltransferase family 4 protein [Halobacteriales archaeon]
MAQVLLLALRFWPATGGVEQRIWEVGKRLSKAHAITVLTSDAKRESPFERFAEDEAPEQAEGMRIVRLPAVRRAPIEGYGVHLRGLRDALARELPAVDVLDLHPYGAAHTDAAVGPARTNGVRVCLTAHLHPAETAGHPWLRAAYDAVKGGATLRAADRVIAVSEPERTLLERRFRVRPERLSVIPNGLDTRHFRDLGQERDRGLLLAVGRLAPVKGFDLALEVLAKLLAQGEDLRLVLAGEDWGEGAELRAHAHRLGIAERVEFAGRVDAAQLLGLYNRAQLLLVPSRYEAFGIAALEAVACGCPALVSDVGGLPAAAGPGGIALPRRAQAWIEAITELLRDADRMQALREAGRAHAERHDWDRIATQVGEVWEELA